MHMVLECNDKPLTSSTKVDLARKSDLKIKDLTSIHLKSLWEKKCMYEDTLKCLKKMELR